jgi:hypothetical protein
VNDLHAAASFREAIQLGSGPGANPRFWRKRWGISHRESEFVTTPHGEVPVLTEGRVSQGIID